MNKERFEKLARWWDEASSQLETGDNEALKRKLHLMEAELRVALKAEPEHRRRPTLAVGLAALALMVVVIGAISTFVLPRLDGATTLASRSEPNVTAKVEGMAVERQPVILPAPPAIEAAAPPSVQASQRRNQPEQRITAARHPRPPVTRRQDQPASAPAEPATPAPTVTVPASTPAREADAPLDALALLVTLEREFEQ